MGAVRVWIRACGIWFRGPYDFAKLERIKDRGGIYVVAAMTRKRLRVLDVGQSKQLRTRLSRQGRCEIDAKIGLGSTLWEALSLGPRDQRPNAMRAMTPKTNASMQPIPRQLERLPTMD